MIHSRLLGKKTLGATLIGVEVGGIWIQSQELIDRVLEDVGQASFANTPVFYIPFGNIDWIGAWKEGLALSEKSLGI